MNINVAIMAYNRPRYLEECLGAIRGHWTHHEIHICHDFPDSDDARQSLEIALKSGCNVTQLKRAGGSVGTFMGAMRESGRDEKDAWTVCLTDDFVVGPKFREAISNAIIACNGLPQVSAVSVFPDKQPNTLPPPTHTTGDHMLGFSINRDAWARMLPLMEMWQQGKIRTQRDDHVGKPTCNEDHAFYTLSSYLGMVPVVFQNRHGEYIGRNGTHSTPEHFDYMGWSGLRMASDTTAMPPSREWLDRAIISLRNTYGTPEGT